MAIQTSKTQSPKSKKDTFLESFYTNNAELDPNDEEARYEQFAKDYEDYGKRKERDKNFDELLQSNEYAPELIDGLISGKNADGTDFDLKEWLKKNDIFVDKDNDPTADAQKIQAEDAQLDAAMEEAGLRPEETAEFISWLYDKDNGFLARAGRFELTKDDFKQMLRIKNYDADISKADEAGYVRGKNENVDIYQQLEERAKENPSLGGGGGARPNTKPEDPTLAALDRMAQY